MSQLSLQEVTALDSSDMLRKVLNFAHQLEEAQEIASRGRFEPWKDPISNVCLAGMGGSGISGDIVSSCLSAELQVPFVVNRHYTLPTFVQSQSLVIVSSYSGKTEETLSAYEEAHRRGAKIVCVTSGGVLAEKARIHNHPLFIIPSGYPPRAALAYLTVPVLYGLYFAGLSATPEAQITESIDLVRALAAEYHPDISNNSAKKISQCLKGKIPLIYSGVDLLAPVGLRWKGQLAENSKVFAFYNVFPELNHNEIMGWGALPDLNQYVQVVYLKDRGDHPRIKKRMEVTKQIIEKSSAKVVEVESRGESRLARMLSLIFLGDITSLYLATLNRVDPTPIEHIDYLKKNLN